MIYKAGLINKVDWKFKKEISPSMIPGKPAIDHIWVTPALFRKIKKCGFIQFGQGLYSDHIPIFIDFNTDIYIYQK